jgi:hypothetical protein
VTNLGG